MSGPPAPPAATPGQAARAAWNDHWAGPDPYPAGESQEETFERVWVVVADAAVDAWLAEAGGDGAPDKAIQRLLADVAERDERLAEVTAERNRIAESCASTAAELSACRQNNAAIAVQLDQYRDERDDARKAFAKLAALFTQGAQSGWTARVSGTVLRRLCVMAMCEPPSGATDNIEAAAMVLFRDYESQCQADHLTWRDFADLARAVIEAA